MLARLESEEEARLWSQQQQWIRERFDQLVPALLTKDGLLSTSEIRVHDDGKVTLE